MQRGKQAVVVSVIFTSFAFFVLAVRLICRFGILRRTGGDDYLAIVAFLLSLVLTILIAVRKYALPSYPSRLTVLQRKNMDLVSTSPRLPRDNMRRCLRLVSLVVRSRNRMLTIIAILGQCSRVQPGPHRNQVFSHSSALEIYGRHQGAKIVLAPPGPRLRLWRRRSIWRIPGMHTCRLLLGQNDQGGTLHESSRVLVLQLGLQYHHGYHRCRDTYLRVEESADPKTAKIWPGGGLRSWRIVSHPDPISFGTGS